MICRLPMNSVYRWIFLLYWFWLIVTTAISLCNFFCFVIIVIYFGTCRALSRLLRRNNNNVKLNFGDWMLLLYLKLNMERNKCLEFFSKLRNYQTEIADAVLEMTPKFKVCTKSIHPFRRMNSLDLDVLGFLTFCIWQAGRQQFWFHYF